MKSKGQVRLRKRKLKGGGWSLYLDIYTGGLRRYEYLHLYLVEERTPEDRHANTETLRVAEAVRARRMIEVQRFGAGLQVASERSVGSLVAEYVETKREKTSGTYEMWSFWAKKVQEWKGCEVRLRDVGREWWTAYARWVGGLPLKATTQRYYLMRMRSVLARGEAEGLCLNPSKLAHIPTAYTAPRVYLSLAEIRALKGCSAGREDIERAFLFGCVAGLRYSDIRALQWEDLEGRRLVFRQKKTRAVQYLDLSAQAVALLGERSTGLVFPHLCASRSDLCRYLNRWAEKAGLTKHISFHTSRHTFAVLMLEAGVDIYTLSRLMGHKSVTTTQVYADIVDRRKAEAMDALPQI